MSSDIDILVAPLDIAAAAEQLCALCYHCLALAAADPERLTQWHVRHRKACGVSGNKVLSWTSIRAWFSRRCYAARLRSPGRNRSP